jgi:hypothetical protein
MSEKREKSRFFRPWIGTAGCHLGFLGAPRLDPHPVPSGPSACGGFPDKSSIISHDQRIIPGARQFTCSPNIPSSCTVPNTRTSKSVPLRNPWGHLGLLVMLLSYLGIYREDRRRAPSGVSARSRVFTRYCALCPPTGVSLGTGRVGPATLDRRIGPPRIAARTVH